MELRGLGFVDFELCAQLLEKHNGEIKLCVRDLMDLERSSRGGAADRRIDGLHNSSKQPQHPERKREGDPSGFLLMASDEAPVKMAPAGAEPARRAPAAADNSVPSSTERPSPSQKASPELAGYIAEESVSDGLGLSLGWSLATSVGEMEGSVEADAQIRGGASEVGFDSAPREGGPPSSMCQLCGAAFFGVDYNAPW